MKRPKTKYIQDFIDGNDAPGKMIPASVVAKLLAYIKHLEDRLGLPENK